MYNNFFVDGDFMEPECLTVVLSNICYIQDKKVVDVYTQNTSEYFVDSYVNKEFDYNANLGVTKLLITKEESSTRYIRYTDKFAVSKNDFRKIILSFFVGDSILLERKLLDSYRGENTELARDYYRYVLTGKGGIRNPLIFPDIYNEGISFYEFDGISHATVYAYVVSMVDEMLAGKLDAYDDGVDISYHTPQVFPVKRVDMDELIEGTSNSIVKNILIGLRNEYDKYKEKCT